MSSIWTSPFSGGYVSARDHYDFVGGELSRMLGAYYKPGDSRVWKQAGRSAFGTVLASNRIKGLVLCQFDSGSDKLVAYAGTALYGATPGTTGAFASLVSGLSSSGTQLTSCHQDDRWYLGNGYDRNRVLKSDGTIRAHGLQAPSTAPTGTPSASAGTTANPTANSGGFTNPTLAYDGSDSTFASATLSAPGTVTHTWTFAADTASNKSLEIKWSLGGLPSYDDSVDRGSIGTGGVIDSGYEVTLLFEKSENAGAAWSTVLTKTLTHAVGGSQSISAALGTGSITVHARVTMTYSLGTNPATVQVRTVRTKTGSAHANFSTTTGIYYAVTWVNDAEGMEGPPSEPSDLVTLSTQNQVLVTRPGSPDAAATHWNIYRIVDGLPATLQNLGYIDTKPIAETTYIDAFTIEATDQATPIVPLMTIGDLSIPRDSPPPAFEFMFVHDASIVGLSRNSPRAAYYSEAGFPESYPEFYVVTAFALDEHDRLLCGCSLGRSAALFAEGAVLAVDGLPRVVDGQFDAGQARPLKGHPGCVGRMAMTPFSVEGEARAAWVSPYGVYQTNGETCEPISLDIDWATEVNTAYLSTALLKWNPKLLVLEFCFDSDGDGANDRVAYIHMSPTHRKANGQPKWSQPTPKRISAIAGGLVGGVYRRYNGHTSDGVAYLEDSGFSDGATGAAVSMDVETGKLGDSRVDYLCMKSLLLHSDWGAGATGTLTVTASSESNGSSQVVAQTISLNGQRGHEVMVARAGEKFSWRFEHSAAAGGAILGVESEMERQGRSVSAGRWQTVSAE